MRCANWGRAIVAGLWVALAALPARAQLVIDGETISDAATVEAARREGQLLVYSTYPADPMKPILAAFQADSGVKVELVRLPTQNMFQRVTAEFAAKKLEADYIDLTDLPLVHQLVARGILDAPRKVPAFDQIPADIRDPDGRWYGMIRPISIIAVNKARVPDADLPQSWNDLLNPKWKGALGLAGIDAGGSAFTLYAFLRERIDPAFWRRLAEQKPRIYPSVAPLATDLARAEVAIGVGAISEQTLAQMQAGAPLQVIFPREGIASFPAAGGITTSARHPNAAALFVDWMTSRHGGDIIARSGAYAANRTSRRPQAAGLDYPPPDQVWNLKLDDWTASRDARIKEWREIFGMK